MIFALPCAVVALLALASAQSVANTTSTIGRATLSTTSTTTTLSRVTNATTTKDKPTTTSSTSTIKPTTIACPQITCYAPPTCGSGQQLVTMSRTSGGCPSCPKYTCECVPKPCPPPQTCRDGSQQATGSITRDANGCPNCPTFLPCPDDNSGPCCEPQPTPVCKDLTYLVNSTTAPLRSGCSENCTVFKCAQCQLPPCVAPPTCPSGMTLTSKPQFFPNGCPSCSSFDCIRTPECPPVVTVNCGPCPAGTKAVKVESVCPSCDKCEPIGSEGATASSGGTIIEKSAVQVTTGGNLFESESGASHATLASIATLVAIAFAASK